MLCYVYNIFYFYECALLYLLLNKIFYLLVPWHKINAVKLDVSHYISSTTQGLKVAIYGRGCNSSQKF